MVSIYQICCSQTTSCYLQHLKTMFLTMFEILVLELEEIGLILNPNKTKLLTTEFHDHDFEYLQNGSNIDEIRDYAFHKWLGKAICFIKGSIHSHAIDSRIAAATRAFYAKNLYFAQNIFQLVLA